MVHSLIQTARLRAPLRGAARATPLGRYALALAVWAAFGLPAPSSLAAEPDQPASQAVAENEQRFAREALPLLTKYCHGCHNLQKAEGDLVLSDTRAAADVPRRAMMWREAIARVADGEMPPKKSPQPSAAERQQLATALKAAVAFVDCTKPYPGRVTLRRLTRVEYRNTVRDWLGVDYAPADDFPADDVGHGFDNIADVLTLPPLLLEKYLNAAEEISLKAIPAEGFEAPLVAARTGRELHTSSLAQREGEWHYLLTEGELAADFELPARGTYRVRVLAFGDQAGGEVVKMAFRLDGRNLAEVEVPALPEQPAMYEHSLAIERGKHRLGVAFLNDFYNPAATRPEARDRNLAVVRLEVRGPLEEARPAEALRRVITAVPGPSLAPEAALRQSLKSLASRAFRRPVQAEELERLVKLAQKVTARGDSYYAGLQVALQALLVNPHFLYKVELDPPGGEVRALNDFELATRLSYFLWSSLPDDELWRLAEQGILRQGDHLEQQVRRMLRDPKARALVDNFAVQWLQLRKLRQVTPDAKMFPTFNDELRQAMHRETELFVGSVFEEDRSVLDLLAADYTFANETLARHYGLPQVQGSEFRRVSLAGVPRGGLLTQASILTVTSNPNRTSPVKRGRWVLENLLADPPPPPAPDAPPLPDDKEGSPLEGTLRERTERHRKDPQCASCHLRMDPLGFALENYNAIGGWRTTDGGQKIDPSGELPSGHKFAGPLEMRTILATHRKTDFVRCVTEKMLTYALGRGLEYYDRCAVNRVLARAAPENYKFSRVVVEIVNSLPFQQRAAKP